MSFNDYSTVQQLIAFFHAHYYSSAIVTYFIVLFETLAFVGVVFPGAIIMPAIGFLIGTNVIPAGSTFLLAIMGAITGDYLSYFLGIYFKGRIHRMWPFTRWPNLLEQGEKYFHAHGGKSVFIGRFVVVVRTVIPLIAGMLKMPLGRFSLATIPAASLWTVFYILPGVLLGALSLELPPKVAFEFALWALLVIAVLWLLFWLTKLFFKQIKQFIDYYLMQIWRHCQKHQTLRWITEILADPRQPDNHLQLILVTVAIFTIALFFFTAYQVATNGFLTILDQPVYHLFSSLRIQSLDYISVINTLLGDAVMLAIVSNLFLAWLLWKRYWYVAIHWFGVMLLCVTAVAGTKILMNLPRPGNILYERFTSSFPSAHTAISIVFYGFLSVIIARELKKRNRQILYAIAGTLVALIALSRLYLGAHWLTDVLGGVFIGLTALMLATISYRRHRYSLFSVHKIALVILSILIPVWIGYSALNFNSQIKKYAISFPKQVVIFNKVSKVAPLYRLNRLGNPIEAFNVEWVGNIQTIKQSLEKRGWKIQPAKIDFLNIVKSFFESSVTNHLPIFSQLYHNKPPVLLLTKETNHNNVILVLYLWASDIKLSDINLPLWIGSIKYYRHDFKISPLRRFIRRKSKFIGATDILTKDLKDFRWTQKIYSKKQQPEEMRALNWDGKVLVIRARL